MSDAVCRPVMPSLALLAGGLATRLRPLTEKIPKSMLTVADEPFIAHQLRQFHRQGILRVVICLGFLGEMVRDFVGDGSRFGLSVEYSADGDVLLGTGGALKKALPLLGDEFMVVYGDSYLPTDFSLPLESFRRTQRLALMTVYRNEAKWDQSNVIFRDGQIIQYDKKDKTPEMAYIDYGLGVLKREGFDACPEKTFVDLADIYTRLLSQEQLAGYEVKERFYEIGSHAGILDTETFLKGSPSL